MVLIDYMGPKKEGGRGLASIEDNIDASIRRLEDKIKKNQEKRITVARNNTNNMMINLTTIIKK